MQEEQVRPLWEVSLDARRRAFERNAQGNVNVVNAMRV